MPSDTIAEDMDLTWRQIDAIIELAVLSKSFYSDHSLCLLEDCMEEIANQILFSVR